MRRGVLLTINHSLSERHAVAISPVPLRGAHFLLWYNYFDDPRGRARAVGPLQSTVLCLRARPHHGLHADGRLTRAQGGGGHVRINLYLLNG